MKKFLLPLLTAGLFATAAMAVVPRLVPEQSKAPASPAIEKAIKNTPSRIVDNPDAVDDWKSLGIGRFNDGFISQPYGTSEPGEYTQRVEIQESEANPGLYRVVNPYLNHPFLNDDEYDASEDHYMIIDATDPENVSIPLFFTGVLYYGDAEKRIWGGSAGAGKLEDGIITFPEWGLGFKTGDNGEYKGWQSANWRATFRVALPGTIDYDFSATAEELCLESAEEVKITLDAGADIATVKWGSFAGRTASDAEYETVASGNNTLDPRQADHNVTVAGEGLSHVIVMAFDASGNEQARELIVLFNTVNNDAEWEEAGEAQLVECFVSSIFGDNYGPNSVTVQLQRNKTDNNRYRLVNPLEGTYAGYYPDSYDHNHYLEFDVTDHEKVTLKTGSAGVNLGYGPLVYVATGTGTYVDGTVTFPLDSYYVGMLDYYSCGLFSVEYDLVIAMPVEHTVTLRSNADAKYGTVAFTSPEASGTALTTTAGEVSVKATPADGVKFRNWTDEEGAVLTAANEYTYIGTSDVVLTANFGVRVKFADTDNSTVTVKDSDATLKTDDYVVPGTDLTVTVVAAEGYTVKGIKVNDELIEGNGTFTVKAETETVIEPVLEAVGVKVTAVVEGNGAMEVWSGMDSDEGAPVAPKFNSGDEAPYGSYVSIFLFPGLDGNGNRESIESVVVNAGGESTALVIGDDVWESDWKNAEGVMVAEVEITVPTVISAKFSDNSSAIDGIATDATDAPAEYFNLQGVKVAGENMQPGVYLMRRGDKVVKVIR